jgi:hypothetical protein
VATDTLVTYKKEQVIITMSRDKYVELCDGYNKLRNANQMMCETQDLYLSDMRNLEKLGFTLSHLGFERGEHHWSDVTIPKEQK